MGPDATAGRHDRASSTVVPLRQVGGTRSSTGARRVAGLPVALSTFVGRAAELAEIRDLLGRARLLTLLGPGGCGKTRLATETAEAASGFAGGVVFIDLAPITDPDGVAAALVLALGLRDEPARSHMDALVEHLDAGSVLVVLDNCEHLAEACAVLAEALLRGCPLLRVLATSREPLDVAGETGWRVPSMSLPPVLETQPAELLRSEAVQLFVERAGRVRTDFTLDAANAAAVSEICRRLEGIPLAIELAAARVRLLTPTQIAAGLDEAFHLLTGGGRTAVARHRTLRASVDWSHGLLSEPERALFRRLGTFAGGFDLAAAEAVGGSATLVQGLDQLALLVDKSLVQREDHGEQTRFRLLETMRQYALERLAEAGEDEEVRRRHRDHYLAVAEAAEDAARRQGQERSLDELTVDLENLRAAFHWSRRAGEPDGALRIAAGLFPLWRMRGRRAEGCAWLDEALATPGEQSPEHRARVLAVRTRIEVDWIDPSIPARVDESIALARRVGDRALLAQALIAGGSYLRGHPDDYRHRLEEALALSQELGDVHLELEARRWSGLRAMIAGRPGEARELLEGAERLADAGGNRYVRRASTVNAGFTLMMQGEARTAYPLLTDAAREAEAAEDITVATLAYPLAGWAAALLGDGAAGEEACAYGMALGRRSGQISYVALAHLGAGMVGLAVGDAIGAAGYFETGWRLTSGFPGLADYYLGPWAEAALAGGDPVAGRVRAADAAAVATRSGFPWQAGWALAAQARVALFEGDPDLAEDLAHRALTVRHGIDDLGGVADTLELLAVLGSGRAASDEAARLLGAASALRAQSGCGRLAVHAGAVAAAQGALTEDLGEAAYAAALTEGSALSRGEAVAYAGRGRGERRRPSHGWAGLTPAEREVVALLLTGLSNKEIAVRLFVSPRTVETHLTRVYAKVGVTSRLRLAQEAQRRDIQQTRGKPRGEA